MALPKKLKYFNMFFDGDNYFGMVPEITPAKLTRKTEDYQAGGMPGSVAVDLGFDAGALDMDITLGGMDAGLLKNGASPPPMVCKRAMRGRTRMIQPAKRYPLKSRRADASRRWIRARPKPGMILPISTP